MRKILLSFGLLYAAVQLHAQPVVQSGKLLSLGSTGKVAVAPGSSISPGNGGANVTWDFSAMNATLAGQYKIVSPDSTPYFSTFPRANYCIQLTPSGSNSSIYEYDLMSSGKWEQLATNYSSVSGNNYNQNPETRLPFPFSYGNSVTDTFVKTTGGPYTVGISYDGYGTLKTPYGTYTNVARIKYDWGPGDYGYHWINTDPVFPIMVYGSEENQYTLIGGLPSGIGQNANTQASVSCSPNPFTSQTVMQLENPGNNSPRQLILTTITGQVVKTINIQNAEKNITLQRDGLANGIYFYQLIGDKGILAQGKLVAE